MLHLGRPISARLLAVIIAGSFAGIVTHTQAPQAQAAKAPGPNESYPNPYQLEDGWAKMPEGRPLGATSAIDIDKDGTSVWLAERCGSNGPSDRTHSCLDNRVDPILHFDVSGKVVKTFGAGLMVAPHGMFVDRDSNIWVADIRDNAPTLPIARGTPPSANPPPGSTKGHQVYKFSPEGKLLMTLGKPGGAAAPAYFFEPGDVLVLADGNILVGDGGHAGSAPTQSRILEFDKNGKLLKTIGKPGSGPGEINQSHGLAVDSQGRLFIANRGNNRLEIFDKDGNFVSSWKQFGRPSSVYIDKNDVLYVGDDESNPNSNPGFSRGMRIGGAKDGTVKYFVPPPGDVDGIAVDKNGVIYGADVNLGKLRKWVRK